MRVLSERNFYKARHAIIVDFLKSTDNRDYYIDNGIIIVGFNNKRRNPSNDGHFNIAYYNTTYHTHKIHIDFHGYYSFDNHHPYKVGNCFLATASVDGKEYRLSDKLKYNWCDNIYEYKKEIENEMKTYIQSFNKYGFEFVYEGGYPKITR